MKSLRTITTAFLLLWSFSAGGSASPAAGQAAQLPLGIRTFLTQHYRGWKLVATADGCSAEFKGAFAAGDFDGDGQHDYIVKVVQGRRGLILAFLALRNGYEEHVLHAGLAPSILRNTGIKVFSKGEDMPVGDEDDNRTVRLKHDAPFDGPCESDAGGVHIYENGVFREL